jgi:hypothetical protein
VRGIGLDGYIQGRDQGTSNGRTGGIVAIMTVYMASRLHTDHIV